MKPSKKTVARSHRDPHGCVQEKSDTALLLIDVINSFDFPTADRLLKHALPAARHIARLKARLRKQGIPAIYVNDNFGRWQSDFQSQVNHCLREASRGAEIARLLHPTDEDYFVLKPKHSAFYSTSLDVLLGYFGARRLILTGFAGNICVLFTANDAYMRDYGLWVPSDCIASESAADNRGACHQMKRFLHADVGTSTRRK